MFISLARPLARGVGHVSQRFGENPKLYAPYGLAGHNGMDYGVVVGTEVRSPIYGTVIEVHDEGSVGYGLHVVITNEKCGVVLAHFSRVLARVDMEVLPGMIIGFSGGAPGAPGAGHSTGPHVHMGFWIGGTLNPAYRDYIDPWSFRDLEI
jgi:murein DD-endopeptidase MepM/ murein hydrolase activator NlpD